jgi:hypothetical protein
LLKVRLGHAKRIVKIPASRVERKKGGQVVTSALTIARIIFSKKNKKNRRPGRRRSPLQTLVHFLNVDPGDSYGPFGSRLLKEGEQKDWRRARQAVTALVAPELSTPDGKAKGRRFNRIMTLDGLRQLTDYLDQNAIRPRRIFVETAARKARISIPGFVGRIEKTEHYDPIYLAVDRLLETGQILRISRCRYCEKFFAKSPRRKLTCSRLACRRGYEKRLAAERQKRRRERLKRKRPATNPRTFPKDTGAFEAPRTPRPGVPRRRPPSESSS